MNPLQAFCTPLHPLHYIQLSWLRSPCTILQYIQLSCLLGAPVLSSTTYNYHVYWEPLYSPPLHTIIMFIGSSCTILHYIQLSCFIGSSCIPSTTYNYHVYWEPLSKYTLQLYEVYE